MLSESQAKKQELHSDSKAKGLKPKHKLFSDHVLVCFCFCLHIIQVYGVHIIYIYLQYTYIIYTPWKFNTDTNSGRFKVGDLRYQCVK